MPSKLLHQGLSSDLLSKISSDKSQPEWMQEYRLDSLKKFESMPMPVWGPDLSKLNLDEIVYYAPTGIEATDDWGELPDHIRKVYEKLGIPEAEHKWLAGRLFV